MNRYLFKAKRKYNGEWIFGNLVYLRCEDKYYIMSYDTNIYNDEIVDYDHIIKDLDMDEVIPETICQYLGSINDIDLYENDIVKGFEGMYDNEVQGTVVFNFENGLQLHCKNNIYHFDYIYDFKVIGNKFDEGDNNE